MNDSTLVTRAAALVAEIERFERHRNAEHDLFGAVWQVVNWSDAAARLAAARRLAA